MVVDAVTCHWFALVPKEEAGPEYFGRAVQWLVALLYTENGILPPPWPYRLQVELDILAGILNQVGMYKNVTKMVGMVCQLFQMVVGHSEAA